MVAQSLAVAPPLSVQIPPERPFPWHFQPLQALQRHPWVILPIRLGSIVYEGFGQFLGPRHALSCPASVPQYVMGDSWNKRFRINKITPRKEHTQSKLPYGEFNGINELRA